MRSLAALLSLALCAPAPAVAQVAARIPAMGLPVTPVAPVGAGALGRAPSFSPSLNVAPSLMPSFGPALPKAVVVTPMVSASPVVAAAIVTATPATLIPTPTVPLSRGRERDGVRVEGVAPSPYALPQGRERNTKILSPVSRLNVNTDWSRVFDGASRSGASPVPADAPQTSARAGLRPANGVVDVVSLLSPAVPYAAGAGILVGTWFSVRGANRLIGTMTKWRGWAPETAVVARLGTEVALWAVGGSVALRVMGLDWTTVFASLGVGGLAVTLATREFLGNFIRGIVLMADSPVRIGDRLLLDKRVGRVVDMTFRYIVLEEAPGQFTLLTYSSLASGPFTLLPRDAAFAHPEPKPAVEKKRLGKGFWIGGALAVAAAVGLGFAVPAALPYLYAVAQLAGTAVLERLAGRLLRKRADKKGWSPTGTAVARLGLTMAFWTIGLLTSLRTAGVAWSALLAGAGVLGVAVGVAAGDILGNLIQAVWLLLARPFRVGDQVAIGASEGKVVDMTLRFVVLESEVDGERRLIHVPYSTAGTAPLRVHAPYPPVRRP